MVIKNSTPQSYHWGKGSEIADWSTTSEDDTTVMEIESVTVKQKYGVGYTLYTNTQEYIEKENSVFDGMKMKYGKQGVKEEDEIFNTVLWQGNSMDMLFQKDINITRNFKWVTGGVLEEKEEKKEDSLTEKCKGCENIEWLGTLCDKHNYCTKCTCSCCEDEGDETDDDWGGIHSGKDETKEEDEENWETIWADEEEVIVAIDENDAERLIMEALIAGVGNVRIQLR